MAKQKTNKNTFRGHLCEVRWKRQTFPRALRLLSVHQTRLGVYLVEEGWTQDAEVTEGQNELRGHAVGRQDGGRIQALGGGDTK